MYILIKNTITVEDVIAESYGIEYSDDDKTVIRIEDISTDKERVEKLVLMCNEQHLDPKHLLDVAEDAVNEFTSK